MAKSLSKWIVSVTFGSMVLIYGPTVFAEVMVDPTRPPGMSGDETMAGGPVLQSVLIGGGRVEAIVSGKVVRVGDRIGEARVIKISDSEVFLQSGSELQTLKLFPAVEKRLAAGRSSVKADLRGQEK